jgi:hypothetical protein
MRCAEDPRLPAALGCTNWPCFSSDPPWSAQRIFAAGDSALARAWVVTRLLSVDCFAVQMKSTLVLLAAMLASASAFAPAAVGMPKAPALRSTKPATSALKMGEFEVTDGTPYKLSVAPVGAFGFAGWVSHLCIRGTLSCTLPTRPPGRPSAVVALCGRIRASARG